LKRLAGQSASLSGGGNCIRSCERLGSSDADGPGASLATLAASLRERHAWGRSDLTVPSRRGRSLPFPPALTPVRLVERCSGPHFGLTLAAQRRR